MRWFLLVVMVVISGCCSGSKEQKPALGVYRKEVGKILRKYEKPINNGSECWAEIEINNVVVPCIVPDSCTSEWWANVREGHTYMVLTEEKNAWGTSVYQDMNSKVRFFWNYTPME